jgi:hypothetical protein
MTNRHGLDTAMRREVTEFRDLLECMIAQVDEMPESVTENPHLYDLLHRVYLRMCGGNIPELGVRIPLRMREKVRR